jgi:hypothetical protein
MTTFPFLSDRFDSVYANVFLLFDSLNANKNCTACTALHCTALHCTALHCTVYLQHRRLELNAIEVVRFVLNFLLERIDNDTCKVGVF